ncbi:sporulation transcriptional regulator SpoIIID [Clostridium perfringens]|uniref:sporulation transcriptional regulator SpoIIID n=1 Tax=Clostridium perfringens TaxID=1502 RepID=UPI001B83A87A|nr:sporulation transcriptional regulator SpoIIID [Clostridium perfringens]HBC2032355.1 sporulation transcriptional regulator SpoIIID [Clostridium perfringens]HBC2056090.1 sporulation transcriptional regulator SpoIIID [Clostridium perfringens]HBC2070210.1 sporulation transcriptional regulator SpoIIID [Clostridium perfringens]
MKQHIEDRVLNVADYIINNKSTIRETARLFGVCKSTIHKDITIRVLKLNPQKAIEVEKVMLFNKSQRHLRGGEATRKRYENARKLNRQAI